jgi:hypothetical protein
MKMILNKVWTFGKREWFLLSVLSVSALHILFLIWLYGN